jgi:hypothetical protein
MPTIDSQLITSMLIVKAVGKANRLDCPKLSLFPNIGLDTQSPGIKLTPGP